MQIFLLAFLGLVGIWPSVQQPDWVEFKSLDGGFAAAMPSRPQTSTLAIQTSRGTLFTHMVSVNAQDRNEYLVSWTEYPEKSVELRATEQTFNKMRDALIWQKQGKLLSDTAGSQQGYPARTIVFSLPEAKFVTVMFCFVENRSYQVLIETKETTAPEVDRFFRSFKLLPAGAV